MTIRLVASDGVQPCPWGSEPDCPWCFGTGYLKPNQNGDQFGWVSAEPSPASADTLTKKDSTVATKKKASTDWQSGDKVFFNGGFYGTVVGPAAGVSGTYEVRGARGEVAVPGSTLIAADGSTTAWGEEGKLQQDYDGNPKVEIATCGNCNKSWNDELITSVTPAPSAMCPFCNGMKEPIVATKKTAIDRDANNWDTCEVGLWFAND